MQGEFYIPMNLEHKKTGVTTTPARTQVLYRRYKGIAFDTRDTFNFKFTLTLPEWLAY